METRLIWRSTNAKSLFSDHYQKNFTIEENNTYSHNYAYIKTPHHACYTAVISHKLVAYKILEIKLV